MPFDQIVLSCRAGIARPPGKTIRFRISFQQIRKLYCLATDGRPYRFYRAVFTKFQLTGKITAASIVGAAVNRWVSGGSKPPPYNKLITILP